MTANQLQGEGHGKGEKRDRFFERAPRFTELVSARTALGEFLVRTWDSKVGRKLFVRGVRPEFRTVDNAMAALRAVGEVDRIRGKVFVDVGANIGTSTIAALRSHPFARAVALEAERDNYRLLKANLALNELDHVVDALNVAVSDTTGTIELSVSRVNSGGHRIRPDTGKRWASANRLHVEKVSLDHLATRGVLDPESVGVIFMDVQGHEGHVVAGANEFVARGIPLVLEFQPSSLRNAGLLDLIEDAVTSNYTHFADLRSLDVGHDPTLTLREGSAIQSFASSLDKDFTDILVVKLDGRATARTPLSVPLGRGSRSGKEERGASRASRPSMSEGSTD